MSQSNLDSAVETFSLLAAGRMDEFLARLADDVEWQPSQVTRPFRGRDGVVQALQEWSEAWSHWEVELIDTIDPGGDKIVLVQRTRGKARGSGIEVEKDYYAVCTLRAGKVARMQQIADRSEAFEAAGLT